MVQSEYEPQLAGLHNLCVNDSAILPLLRGAAEAAARYGALKSLFFFQNHLSKDFSPCCISRAPLLNTN